MYGDQIEMTFHDTVPLPEDQIQEAREKAQSQKDKVLDFFFRHQGDNFTPAEVWGSEEFPALMTSIRRCITDLTKEGRLIKCPWSESRKGEYGKLNRCWRYNEYYVKPLNPKK